MLWKYLTSPWEPRERGWNLNPKEGDFPETLVKDDLREGGGREDIPDRSHSICKDKGCVSPTSPPTPALRDESGDHF